MYNLVDKRFWYFLISGLLIVIGVVAMVIPGNLKWSTDFSPGTQLTVTPQQDTSVSEVRQEMSSLGFGNVEIRTETPISGGTTLYIVKTQLLSDQQQRDIVTGLQGKFGSETTIDITSVSSVVARETVLWAAVAVVVAAVAMLIYIIWAFRKMPHPLRYGACAVIALIHDLIVAVGLFALIAMFTKWEVDLMLVTALLTILGYSINNTIVVFDRIRENVRMGVSPSFDVIVNDSVVASMGRCLNTSLVTAIGLLALLVIVGGTIENFAVVFLIGLIAGTYDSIFVAPMLLVVWEKKEWGRFIGLKPKAAA
jgi:preprotein translocase subunit SecF